MKHILLILVVLLSGCSFNGGDRGVAHCVKMADAVIGMADDQLPDDSRDFGSAAILPIRPAEYSGENTNCVPSYRSDGSGRRVQPSQKSSFLVVRQGKVTDRHSHHAYLRELMKFQCGIHSSERYLHTICTLLI